ncbi:hypothetical protein V6N13_094584 [Hibiscus sabdariffa]
MVVSSQGLVISWNIRGFDKPEKKAAFSRLFQKSNAKGDEKYFWDTMKVCNSKEGLDIGSILKECKKKSRSLAAHKLASQADSIPKLEKQISSFEDVLENGTVDNIIIGNLRQCRSKLWSLICLEEHEWL